MNSIPILLILFNRPEHTCKTLQSLLIQHPNELYLFQDGPRSNNDNDIVQCKNVRDVVDKLLQNYEDEIIIHKNYSTHNRGCRDAIIYAVSSVLQEHDAVIVVEDDIITSPAFLSYMNQALNYYKDRKTVYSISGHSPAPERFTVNKNYPYDVFASPRLFNWGWGTWKDRWENVDWSMSYFDEFIQDSKQVEAFNRGGDDMTPMLIDEKNGKSSAWDIQFAFHHFKNHAVSIVPCVSYTTNIGCDGSGTHCGYDLDKNKKEYDLCIITDIKWIDILYFDKQIINLLHSAYSRIKRPIWQRVINFLVRKIGKKSPFIIKKKVYA